MPDVGSYIMLGLALFAVGMVGFLARRNLIVMFLSTEIMLQGVLLNVVGFGKLYPGVNGQVFGLFVLVIAAVEAGLGLGLVVLLFRRKSTLDAEAWATMHGKTMHGCTGKRRTVGVYPVTPRWGVGIMGDP
jgi:NADH-quinone oxidoreductase subunit K